MDGMQLHATCLKLGALSRLNVFLLYGEHGHVVAGTRRLRLNREAPAGLSNAVVEIHRTPVSCSLSTLPVCLVLVYAGRRPRSRYLSITFACNPSFISRFSSHVLLLVFTTWLPSLRPQGRSPLRWTTNTSHGPSLGQMAQA